MTRRLNIGEETENSKTEKQCVKAHSNVMLNQFNPNQLPTLAWALIGFTGLAFCQQSEVRSTEGRNEYYTWLQCKEL